MTFYSFSQIFISITVNPRDDDRGCDEKFIDPVTDQRSGRQWCVGKDCHVEECTVSSKERRIYTGLGYIATNEHMIF